MWSRLSVPFLLHSCTLSIDFILLLLFCCCWYIPFALHSIVSLFFSKYIQPWNVLWLVKTCSHSCLCLSRLQQPKWAVKGGRQEMLHRLTLWWSDTCCDPGVENNGPWKGWTAVVSIFICKWRIHSARQLYNDSQCPATWGSDPLYVGVLSKWSMHAQPPHSPCGLMYVWIHSDRPGQDGNEMIAAFCINCSFSDVFPRPPCTEKEGTENRTRKNSWRLGYTLESR